jgi:hypothetical protein
MQIMMALVAVVLVVWAQPATAQTTFSVSVSHHSGVPALTEEEVTQILADASKMLQKDSSHEENDDDVACKVTFTLKGPIQTFALPSDAVLWNKSQVEMVHNVDSQLDTDFHIKVVEKIKFCRGTHGDFHGCAYPPEYRSIIVIHPKRHVAKFPAHVMWTHEFGHLTGLGHRRDKYALMKCGGVTEDSMRLKRAECRCLLLGPNNQTCELPPTLWC